MKIHLPTMPSYTHTLHRRGLDARDQTFFQEWLAEAKERMEGGGVNVTHSSLMVQVPK